MNLKYFYIFLLFAQSCFAEDSFCKTGKQHPIDIQFNKEIENSGGVTVRIREAQSKAYELWDSELNNLYKDLMSSMRPQDQDSLKKSQRSWLAYRDAQEKLWWSESLYGSGGTLASVAVSDLARDLLKNRVCEFVEYKKMVNLNGEK